MDRERKGKTFQRNFPATDRARRTTCLRAEHVRSQSSPPCVELFRRAWLIARCRGNLFSGTVAPVRREKSHRRTQDQRAAARCVRKVAEDRDAQPAIPALIRSQGKVSPLDQMLQRAIWAVVFRHCEFDVRSPRSPLPLLKGED